MLKEGRKGQINNSHRHIHIQKNHHPEWQALGSLKHNSGKKKAKQNAVKEKKKTQVSEERKEKNFSMLLKEHIFKTKLFPLPPFMDPIKCLQMLNGFY